MPGARRLFLTLLVSGAAATSQPVPRPAGPPCSYAGYAPETRQLFAALDTALAGCVRQTCVGARQQYASFFELDGCWAPTAYRHAFANVGSGTEARLRSGLSGFYAKKILDTGHLQVLRYRGPAAASAAQAVMDSIARACRGRDKRTDEPCIGTEIYSVTRRGRFILRFDVWAEDPMLNVAIREVKSRFQLRFKP